MPRSTRKKFIYVFAFFAGALMLLILALPLWWPWVLRPILKATGLQYSGLSRSGYGRDVLYQVQYANQEITFRAERIEALIPTEWLWRRYFKAGPAPFLEIDQWELSGTPNERPLPGSPVPTPGQTLTTGSLDEVWQEVEPVLDQLRTWLPRALLQRGTLKPGTGSLSVPLVIWNGGQVSARLRDPALAQSASLEADLRANQHWHATLQVLPAGVDLDVALDRDVGVVKVRGTAQWRTNRVALAADFDKEGWWPATGLVQANSFRVPSEMLSLRGYQDVTGAVTLRWTRPQFQVDLHAQAEPLETNSESAFPVEVSIGAHGTTNEVVIREASVRTPWLHAEVTPEVGIDYSGRLLSPEAIVTISSDLAQQHWLEATGRIDARASLSPGARWLPRAVLSISGKALNSYGLQVSDCELQGTFDWPWVDVTKADAHFAEGATLALLAKVNLADRFVTNAVVHLAGKVGTELLSTNSSYRSMVLHANVSGPIQDLQHDMVLNVTELSWGELAPMDAAITSVGHGNVLDDLKATLTGRGAALFARGSATANARSVEIAVRELSLGQDGQPVYALDAPWGISITREPLGPLHTEWEIKGGLLQWRGKDSSIVLNGDVAWPARGNFDGVITNLTSSVFNPFLKKPLAPVHVDYLRATGGWSNGPAHFQLALGGNYSTRDQVPIAARIDAESDARVLQVRTFELATQSTTVLSGTGRLPVWFEPTDRTSVFHLGTDQPVELHAVIRANPKFWDELSTWLPVRMMDPRVQIDISGPLLAPKGKITAEMAALIPTSAWTNKLVPQLTELQAEVQLDRAEARLDHLRFRVDGQPVEAVGQIPMGTNFSSNWRRFFQWEQATGAVRIVDAQIAPFARYAPQLLSPQGAVNLDVTLRPRLQWGGTVRLDHAATRPLAALGPVQNLEARLHLGGRAVQLETFTGVIGGEPFSVTGSLDFGRPDPVTGMPLLDLKILGQDIPLAREPEMIVRSDVNLSISNKTNGPAVVSGSLRLRDSVFLSDLRMLKPGKVAQPKQRPPYFSIDLEPLAQWRLNVHVQGDKFLKVRSPFFHGEVSTDVKLEGNLNEPMVLGEVTVNSGMVQFPFATLEITQGLVSFTSADPYRPKLFVSASGRALGYDVRMEVTGTADSPVIQFSSTPPLSSEQVLVMVTAGEGAQAENQVTTQQRASRLALFLGKSLLSEFTTGTGGADRLTIRSGEYLSEQGQQTYSLEYRLTKDWSLVGEYDRFGAYNAGVKWHIYSH